MQEGPDSRYLKVVSTAKHYADYDLEGNGGIGKKNIEDPWQTSLVADHFSFTLFSFVSSLFRFQSRHLTFPAVPSNSTCLFGLNSLSHLADTPNRPFADRGAFNAIVTDQDQVEYYWPAWRAAAEGAHVQSIMCSYNAVNGVPSCGNSLFMNTVLRGQFQFDGFAVSDCGAIGDAAFTKYILSIHGTPETQAATALTAGCDLNCGSYYAQHLADAVRKGALNESDVDDAFVRVWKHAFMLGLFENTTYKYVCHLGAWACGHGAKRTRRKVTNSPQISRFFLIGF
jgi:hypothetical protein